MDVTGSRCLGAASSQPLKRGSPGTTGTPAAAITAFASALSPIERIAAAGGPTNLMPAAAQASEKGAFSERKPYLRSCVTKRVCDVSTRCTGSVAEAAAGAGCLL